MTSPLLTSRSGFSILLALGSTGILLVIVVGMASVFLSEMRLSRLQYDSILSSTQAEWAFEYAMLKVANHRDGFQDTMLSTSPDALIWSGSTLRTDKVRINYTIRAQSSDATFSWGNDTHIIVPLFVGKCQGLLDTASCNPEEHKITNQVQSILELSSSSSPNDLYWSIVGMSGSENISLAGTGIIDGSEIGTLRLQSEQCLDISGATTLCDSAFVEERLTYFYDFMGSTADFLGGSTSAFRHTSIRDPYLLIWSPWVAVDIHLRTTSPFTLPKLEVTAEARKWDALQVIRFTEDKSRYYDALKYGVYNTGP